MFRGEQGISRHNNFVVRCWRMDSILLLNDREVSAAKERLAAVDRALLPENAFSLTSSGISAALIERHADMLRRRKRDLETAIGAYGALRNRDDRLLHEWRHEPGVTLVLTRINRGMSQRQLADRLGMREQQIQRYESDRYRAISLSNLKRVCAALEVSLFADASPNQDEHEGLFLKRPDKLDPNELRRVLAHAKKKGWLSKKDADLSDADSVSALVNYATSLRDRYGGPVFLRKGGTSPTEVGILSLHAWRARVSSLAREKASQVEGRFDPTDIGWIRSLVKLSNVRAGPLEAVSLLSERGIVLIVEEPAPGTKLDGAAFLEGDVPVVGLTLRFDRIDHFWFTLLHEIGHVFLHLDHGLAGGFFDDFDVDSSETVEKEANEFASSSIVAPELWRLSPARLAKSADVVETLARQLGIHPALIFGKIRNERKDYSIFATEVGQGAIRHLFFERDSS